jgi:hypothetical protein
LRLPASLRRPDQRWVATADDHASLVEVAKGQTAPKAPFALLLPIRGVNASSVTTLNICQVIAAIPVENQRLNM